MTDTIITAASTDHPNGGQATSERTVPAAVPTDPSIGGASPLVSGASNGSSVKTTPAVPVVASHSRPATQRPLGRLQRAKLTAQLSDRDRHVLNQLAAHRYLSTEQLVRLVFTDHASAATAQRVARRVLGRLQSWQLIRPLSRRIGGFHSGSTSGIWQLSSAGMRFVQQADNDCVRHRPYEPSPRILRHCLAVTDAHLVLRDLRREPDVDDVSVQLEPACWRSYSGLGGETRCLQPDQAAVIRGVDQDGTFEDRWFIEVDLATESVATLLRKCVQYQDYRNSGIEQANHDGVFPLVLWVLHGPRAGERAAQLQVKIRRDARLEPALYRFVVADHLADTLRAGLSGASS